MRRGKGKAGAVGQGGPAVPDLDFAVNLHRVVAQALPRRLEVDSIPPAYLQTFWKPFPIPPEVVPAGPGGLATVLQRDFGHLLNFSQNRAGVWCADLVFPPETPLEEVARFHIDCRSGPTQAPQPLQPVQQVPTPALQSNSPQGAVAPALSRPLTKEEESSSLLIAKGLHRVLLAKPEFGQAESLNDLRDKLRDGFYQLFGIPMVLSSGAPIDPIEVLKKNQQKAFSRILEDPMTGAAAVKPVVDNTVFVAVTSMTVGGVAQVAQPGPVVVDPLIAGMKQLKSVLAENLMLIDKGLAGPVNAPDEKLWKTALATLVQQETQTRDILVSLFK